MKIAILGPTYPYKSGPTQFTTQMTRAFADSHEIVNISYRVQYPKILFPRGEQTDFFNTALKLDNVHFWLNTVNPINWISTAAKINKLNSDVLLMQWIHPFFAPSYWTILKCLNKRTTVIFICHNVFPHESFPMAKLFTKAVLKQSDAFVVMSDAVEQDLRLIMKTPRVNRINHPTYDLLNASVPVSRQAARESFGLSDTDFVLLFFGYIREYKGLRVLLDAFPEIVKRIPKTVLLIGGEFNKGEKDKYLSLISVAQSAGGKIIVAEDYIPDSDVARWFATSDIVMLPYLSATQSGVVANAYTYNKPVIVSDVGGLPETVVEGETGYVVSPGNKDEIVNAVLRFYEHPNKSAFEDAIEMEAEKYSWGRLVEAVESICTIKTG